MSIIRDHEGKTSSKRVLGIIYLLAFLVMIMFKEFHDRTISNPELVVGGMITGASLLGLEVAKYFHRTPKTKQNGEN